MCVCVCVRVCVCVCVCEREREREGVHACSEKDKREGGRDVLTAARQSLPESGHTHTKNILFNMCTHI